ACNPASQLSYSATNVWSGLGSLRSTKLAACCERRIRAGVSSVVIADTATATGYTCGPTTSSERPSPAMMNENSPICARLIPAATEVCGRLPDMNAPNDTLVTLPATTI